MNRHFLEKVLSKDGADEFDKLINRRTNTKLRKYFVEILEYHLKDFDKPSTRKDLDNPSWALRRAYHDGGKYYIQQLYNLFKE